MPTLKAMCTAPVAFMLAPEGERAEVLMVYDEGAGIHDEHPSRRCQTHTPITIFGRRVGVPLVERHGVHHVCRSGEIVRGRKLRPAAGTPCPLGEVIGDHLRRRRKAPAACVDGSSRNGVGSVRESGNELRGPALVRLAVVVREQEKAALRGANSDIPRGSRPAVFVEADQARPGSVSYGGGDALGVRRSVIDNDDLERIVESLPLESGQAAP
jgi:hypothetical protein